MYQKLGLGEYYGDAVRRRQAFGFAVTENNFAGGQKTPWHEHTLSHFTCVLEGGFTETYSGETFDCAAGTVLVVPGGVRHFDEVWPEGAHTLSFEVGPKFEARLAQSVNVLDAPSVTNDAGIGRAIGRLYTEFRSADAASLVALAALAMEMLAAIERTRSQRGQESVNWMQRVMAILHSDPGAGGSLAALAEQAGVHEAHLAKTFRRLHGCSVGEYVRWLRLEEAKNRLRTTEAPIGDIAVDAGFYDQAHFSRVFRKTYGLPPSKYRKAMSDDSRRP